MIYKSSLDWCRSLRIIYLNNVWICEWTNECVCARFFPMQHKWKDACDRIMPIIISAMDRTDFILAILLLHFSLEYYSCRLCVCERILLRVSSAMFFLFFCGVPHWFVAVPSRLYYMYGIHLSRLPCANRSTTTTCVRLKRKKPDTTENIPEIPRQCHIENKRYTESFYGGMCVYCIRHTICNVIHESILFVFIVALRCVAFSTFWDFGLPVILYRSLWLSLMPPLQRIPVSILLVGKEVTWWLLIVRLV